MEVAAQQRYDPTVSDQVIASKLTMRAIREGNSAALLLLGRRLAGKITREASAASAAIGAGGGVHFYRG